MKILSVIATLNSFVNKKSIPTKIINLNKDLIAKFIAENSNSSIDKVEFPSKSEHTKNVPFHKKKDESKKSNYRPVSILSNYSKLYENLMYNQIYQYFDKMLFRS